MIQKLKDKLENLARRNSYNNSEERLADKLLWGGVMLELKRNLWEKERYQFSPNTWDEFGFSVFSQSNEDGLIQYLIRQIPIPNKTFVEFGCSSYTECNTRFLLLHDKWQGLVMDGSKEAISELMNKDIYWQHDLAAVSAFITKENINELIADRGFRKDIGLLSIDIDGNDYWVWDAIDCVSPRIVICEYNPIFGSEMCVSVPYKEDFYRTDAHYSNLYWGASLAAYVRLGKKKGYKLVCVNQMGHNAFFVRNDVGEKLQEVSVKEAYRRMMYRESRDRDGNMTYLSPEEGLDLICEEQIVDITDGKQKSIRQLL